MSEPFDLVVLELHGRHPPEDGHHDLELPALRVEVVDGALEVHERPLDDTHLVALLERRLELRLLRALLHLTENPVDLVGGEGHRLGPRAHEPRDLRRRAHEVPGVVGELHLHEEIAGEELLLDLDLLALPDLPHLLRRHHDPADHLGQAEDLGARLDRLRHLVLEPRVGVHDEPLLRLGRGLGLAHFRILSTMRESPMSTAPRKKASTNTTTTTTTVEFATSARLGHVTRRNSAATSRKN